MSDVLMRLDRVLIPPCEKSPQLRLCERCCGAKGQARPGSCSQSSEPTSVHVDHLREAASAGASDAWRPLAFRLCSPGLCTRVFYVIIGFQLPLNVHEIDLLVVTSECLFHWSVVSSLCRPTRRADLGCEQQLRRGLFWISRP